MKPPEYPPTLMAFAKIAGVVLVLGLALYAIGAGCSHVAGRLL